MDWMQDMVDKVVENTLEIEKIAKCDRETALARYLTQSVAGPGAIAKARLVLGLQ